MLIAQKNTTKCESVQSALIAQESTTKCESVQSALIAQKSTTIMQMNLIFCTIAKKNAL